MKIYKTILALACLGLVSPVGAEEPLNLEDSQVRLSYSYGMILARNIKNMGVEIDVTALAAGIRHTLADKTLISRKEADASLRAFNQKRQDKMVADREVLTKKNEEEGAAFLAENKKKAGVITLDSGLQYKIITAGSGASPTAKDTVSTHYKGTLLDGTEFDSSYGRGQPAEFRVDGVIKGWTEALQLMKVGAKWELYIPSYLAYGKRLTGKITPSSTLVFVVELLDIKK